MVRISLVGPPGAGKGTQAKMLAQQLGLPHIATGDLFRQAQEQGTPLGRQVRSYMEEGKLVPDDIATAVVVERLNQPGARGGFILDGYPRTLEQARALASHGLELDAVLYLSLSRKEVVERISGRRVCRVCQAPYHLRYAPPREQGVCDRCGGELYQRPDDTPQRVGKRYDVYLLETRPVLDLYRRQRKLVKVDGSGSIEEVKEATLAALGKEEGVEKGAR